MNEKEKLKVVSKDFNSPFIRSCIWVKAFSIQAKEFNCPHITFGIAARKNQIEYIGMISMWVKGHENFKRKVDKDMFFVDKLIDKTNRLGKEFNKWSEKEIFNKDLSKLKNDNLIGLLKEFVEKQSLMYAYGLVLPLLDFHDFSFVEGNLKKFLKEKAEDNFEEYYQILTEPLHNSFAQDQEEDLLNLMKGFYNKKWVKDMKTKSLSEIKTSYPKFYEKLQEHTKKHGWVYYVYAGPAFTENNFLDFIKDYLNKNINPDKKLKENKNKKKDIEKKKKEIIEKLNPDKFNKMILNLVGKLVWAKPRRKDYQSKSYYHLEKLMREFSKRLYISLEQARSTPVEMLEKGLKTGQLDINIINSIYNFHVCIPKQNGGVETLYGGKAEEYYDLNVEKQEIKVEDVNEVQGVCAHPGKVKGIIKLINRPEDMGKMDQGDILLSSATTPSIVPAMKKAAAIVTDEGGLTCHASIVSRELEIPCVIGTKTATQVLKDGDLAEVDADQGVVKILKRKV